MSPPLLLPSSFHTSNVIYFMYHSIKSSCRDISWYVQCLTYVSFDMGNHNGFGDIYITKDGWFSLIPFWILGLDYSVVF